MYVSPLLSRNFNDRLHGLLSHLIEMERTEQQKIQEPDRAH